MLQCFLKSVRCCILYTSVHLNKRMLWYWQGKKVFDHDFVELIDTCLTIGLDGWIFVSQAFRLYKSTIISTAILCRSSSITSSAFSFCSFYHKNGKVINIPIFVELFLQLLPARKVNMLKYLNPNYFGWRAANTTVLI